MKIILCIQCFDVFKLSSDATRFCKCKASWGHYLQDGLKAEVSDSEFTQVIGFHNGSLRDAILAQREHGDQDDGMGRRFTAFLMPDNAPNVTKTKLL